MTAYQLIEWFINFLLRVPGLGSIISSSIDDLLPRIILLIVCAGILFILVLLFKRNIKDIKMPKNILGKSIFVSIAIIVIVFSLLTLLVFILGFVMFFLHMMPVSIPGMQ